MEEELGLQEHQLVAVVDKDLVHRLEEEEDKDL